MFSGLFSFVSNANVQLLTLTTSGMTINETISQFHPSAEPCTVLELKIKDSFVCLCLRGLEMKVIIVSHFLVCEWDVQLRTLPSSSARNAAHAKYSI